MSKRAVHLARYGVATLLFIILCVAGVLSGYRFGFKQGYVAGSKKRQSEANVAEVYPAADLVLASEGVTPETLEAVDLLIEVIKESIDPTSWDDVGGDGTAEFSLANLSLVISQTPEVHTKIRGLLRRLRDSNVAPVQGSELLRIRKRQIEQAQLEFLEQVNQTGGKLIKKK